MIIDADKASTKICPVIKQTVQQMQYHSPQTIYNPGIGTYTTTPSTQTPYQVEMPSQCRGKACMAWREMAMDKGYCGLAGMPASMAAFFQSGES